MRGNDIEGSGVKNRFKKFVQKVSSFSPFKRKATVMLGNSLKQTHSHNPQGNNYKFVEPNSITPQRISQSELRHTIGRTRMKLPINQGPVINKTKWLILSKLVEKRKAKANENPYEDPAQFSLTNKVLGKQKQNS